MASAAFMEFRINSKKIIPVAAGLSAAAAAGLGAKAYLDRKENNDNGEEDDWQTDDKLNMVSSSFSPSRTFFE